MSDIVGTRDATRCIAIVGPFQSGKTTLLEAILERAGSLDRAGSVTAGNSVRDASAEARAHAMSVEPNFASAEFLGETVHFIDCAGSIEFGHDMRAVLPVCDAAIVVCEADERKLPALELILRELEEADIPRFLFINKIDAASQRIGELLPVLQKASRTPLLMRQIPIWKEGIAVGFVDLALERAFIYREHAPSEIAAVDDGETPDKGDARFRMLERLADYDDALMEELIADIEPPRDRVFDDLARELRERHVVPVLLGSAQRGNGVTRLLKALRHEAPRLAETRDRLGLSAEGPPLAQIVKTLHTQHGGKISIARIMRGAFKEGETVVGSLGAEARIAGLVQFRGGAQTRIVETREGEMHLRVAIERLASRFGVVVETGRSGIGYNETIRGPASARGRHKKQTGGHGQFGDVVLEVRPLPCGEGVVFTDQITGGVVPRQYIPSVETGVRETLKKGPLGFPVVDIAVTLTDGSCHNVDSSDAAFQAAARLAINEALPKAKTVLLEPILAVEIFVPSETIAKATAIVSSRRGQILGFDSRPGWEGWDVLDALIAEAEMGGLIVELRSATSGVGTFRARFDHMAELGGKPAEAVALAKNGG